MPLFAINYTLSLSAILALRCPECKARFSPAKLIDPYIQGIVCEHGHSFFIEFKVPNGSETMKAAQLQPYAGKSSKKIMEFWLTDRKYRMKLNCILATIVRRIYEISCLSRKIPGTAILYSSKYSYCPICQEQLVAFYEGQSSWSQDLKCKNNHTYSYRRGVAFTYENKTVYLIDEMSDELVYQQAKGWIDSSKKYEMAALNLHPQIRTILYDYISHKNKECNGK